MTSEPRDTAAPDRPQTLQFNSILACQARALGRIAGRKKAPHALVWAKETSGVIIVVPASLKDRRRWDITKGGRIIKKER
jgi:hypothetical protein